MDLEVDTEELRYCEHRLVKSSDELKTEINYWESEIEKLKKVWSGTEANVFYTKMEAYLIKLKMLSETTSIFGNAIKECTNNYEKTDTEFASKVREENSKYDDDAFLNDPRNKKIFDKPTNKAFLASQGMTNEVM